MGQSHVGGRSNNEMGNDAARAAPAPYQRDD
jgi:hypothetical protein